MHSHLCALATALSVIAAACGATAELPVPEYHEQLVLRPLPLSSVLASFNFKSNITDSAFKAQDFRYFPRSFGQILRHIGTRELHLRFALGRWDAESWGTRPWDGAREGGTGVELWAWLDAQSEKEADQKWVHLTNALSGLFCASLNFIDSTKTTRPVVSFWPEGDHPNATLANSQLLHGVLPHEVVCTENLTPFLKLLPCKGKTGISSLLDGHKLFDASWQSMAVDVRPICPPHGGECVLEIEQTIDMVLDIDRSKRPRGNPIPRPPPAEELKCDTSKTYHSQDTCFPKTSLLGQDWTLSQIFGRPLKGTCPITDPTIPPVCVQVPNSRQVLGSSGAQTVLNPSGNSRCYYMDEKADFDLEFPAVEAEPNSSLAVSDVLVKPLPPLLYAERSLMGHGQERGAVQAILRNPSETTPVEFVYMEWLPWFMRIYLHTLEARINGQPTPWQTLVHDMYYRPAVDRQRGTQLELRIVIPPASTVFLTYDFEKTILRYTEYPPDANRGFDVAASIITILSPSNGRRVPASMRTTNLLLNLPTPDFSMPYNVIIFSSTCIALAFGGLFNILVRRFVGADEAPKGKFSKLMTTLRTKFQGRTAGGFVKRD